MGTIYKYNKPKDNGNGSGGSGSNSYTVVTTVKSSDRADKADRLSETHLIFGLPFDGTLDVDGDLYTSGNITAEGDITGDNVNANTVNADLVNTDNISADKGTIEDLKGSTINYDEAAFKQAVIDALSSTNITTDYLTVTKLAHFFELIIDKIKAAGGAVLLTPADGFKVDRVIHIGNAYRVCWLATDGDKTRKNMWQVGDLAICLTFNATEGVSQNVSNKYYWALVQNVGSNTYDDIIYNYIDLSFNDYDGTLNPEVGDEIAMLGYRGTDDEDRLSAIYLAAYNSIDPTLKAPLICHYKGINNFDLKSHKYTWFAANGSEIRGNVKIESGESVEDITNSVKVVSTVVEYKADTLGTTPPLTGWTTTIPTVSAGGYLWTRTTVTYADGNKNVSYSVTRFGADGLKGDKGNAGNDGTSCNLNLLLGTKEFSGDNWVNLQYWDITNDYYLGCRVIKRSSNQYGVYLLFNAEAGKTYTFSAYLKSDGGDARYYFTITDANGVVTPLQKDVPEAETWSRLAVSFKCTTSGEIACRVLKAAGTGAIYVAGYKLEEGDVEDNTVWIPAALEMLGADYYALNPLVEKAWVDSNGWLGVDFQYNIMHCEGDKTTIITKADNILVRAYDNTQPSKAIYLQWYGNYVRYDDPEYLEQYGINREYDTKYFTIELLVNGEVVQRRFVSVIYLAYAIFEINERIFSRVGNTEGKVSEIEQTAEQIRLQVDDIALRIDGKKIVLDGNTEVNGTVNINLDGTGFRLNGSNGETFTIGSNDIGNYSDFENKTIFSWLHTMSNTIYFTGTGRVSLSYNFNSNCTTLKSGLRFRITNLGIGLIDNSLAGGAISNLAIALYKGNPSSGNLVASNTISSGLVNGYWYLGTSAKTGTKSALIDYTATSAGDYYVRIYGTATGNSGGNTELRVSLWCENSLNAFGSLTYNGFGFNFGAGKVAFIGDDAMVFKMGANAGLRLTDSDGLQRLVADSYKYSGANILHRYANSNRWIGVNDYVVREVSDSGSSTFLGTLDYVSPRDEMLVIKNISYPMILVLPNPSECIGKSYLIKNYSSSDNVFISGGTLSTTSSTSGNILRYDGNTSFNESCRITTTGSSITYYQLLKCYKHSHKLVSDGTKWVDCLLSN